MTDVIPFRDALRFSGELNHAEYWQRRRYLHNIHKQEKLDKLKNKFSKGEYAVLINNLGKTIKRITQDKLPENHVSSFWINNLHKLRSFEKDLITFYYTDDDGNKIRASSFYYDDTIIDEINDFAVYKLTCKIVDIDLPESFLGKSCQQVTLMDDDSNKTLKALIHNNYVDERKWKHGSEVELIGGVIEPRFKDCPPFQIFAMDYTKEYAHEIGNLIELEQSNRNTPEYDYWRNQVLERDKVCQCCGDDKSLEVHHIFSYKYEDALRINPENGIVLCKSCHTNYHKKYGKIATPRNLIKFIQRFGLKNL